MLDLPSKRYLAQGVSNVDFAIDEMYLAAHTIASATMDGVGAHLDRAVKAFQGHAKQELSPAILRDIEKHSFYFLFPNVSSEAVRELTGLMSSRPYYVIYAQTLEQLAAVKGEWLRNFPEVRKEIWNATGVDLSSLSCRVLITHPAIAQGQHVPDTAVLWSGGMPHFKNYSTVYLVHELFHGILKNNDVSHAIIELIADNHIRALLGGESEGPDARWSIGHPELLKLRKKLFPFYRDYLHFGGGQIEIFEKEMMNRFTEDVKGNVF